VSGAGVTLTSLDKVLWPAAGFAKGHMLDYYERIAPTLLAHIAGRPLTLGRYPDGIDGPGFAQTECRGAPEFVDTVAIELRDGRVRNFCVAKDTASLLWIANLGTIELHVFLGETDSLQTPSGVLFDLDPEPPAGIVEAARVALVLRDRLAEERLRAVVKTTGGEGLHVFVPLGHAHCYDRTRAFARQIAAGLAADDELIVASATRRELRAGTVLIDWAQNSERRTMLAPYSLRASDLPAVSTPLRWDELERASVQSLRFSPSEVLDRVERIGDAFEPAFTTGQSLG
jgi:bifunctional non-homologous end joining protein LigD